VSSQRKINRDAEANTVTIKAFFDEATFTVSYVVSCDVTHKAIIIDTVLDYDHSSGRTMTRSADAICTYADTQKLDSFWILETHIHADHLSAAPYLRRKLGGQIAVGSQVTQVQKVFGTLFNAEADFLVDGSQFDRLLQDGDTIEFGAQSAIALHTPGHTPACVSYLVGDTCFVGDTLFMPDFGTARCDFPGGDARTLYQSIQKILSLPAETRLFMCHDYKAEGRNEYAWETTVGEQLAANIHVSESIDEDAFVQIREERDKELQMPSLILPSVQVNMRAGSMPPPEDNGTTYLKIPINAV